MWQWSGVLDGLAVMTLTKIGRDWGLIPNWGTKFFQIANHHLFDPLLHRYCLQPCLWGLVMSHWSGLSLTLVYSSTNMSKSVWTSGFWKPLIHKNISNFWNNIFHKFSIALLLFAYFVCSRCGRVNFGVDEWLFWTTRPQYECLKILSEWPAGSGTYV